MPSLTADHLVSQLHFALEEWTSGICEETNCCEAILREVYNGFIADLDRFEEEMKQFDEMANIQKRLLRHARCVLH